MALTHKEIMEIHEADVRAEQDNRDDIVDDMRFRAGDQWDTQARIERTNEGRPVTTVNMVGQYVRQVSGDLRQTHPSIIPVPVDGEGDEVLTEIMQGLIRQIEYQSGASSAYAYGAECAIAYGIGHWRILTDYTREDSFDQDIIIRRIMDPNAVTWDMAAMEIDRSDARHCTVTEMISMRDFKARFPDKVPADVPNNVSNGASIDLYWRREDMVRIAEYWERREVEKLIGLTEQGVVIDLSRYRPEMYQFLGITRTRKAKGWKIVQHLMDGSDFLADPKEWPGVHIPIVSCIGEELPIESGTVRHGIVRWLKDPQRIYNFYRSAALEAIALQPKAPFIGPIAAFQGVEKYWKQANRANFPYLPYNPDPALPNGGRPERQSPPVSAAGLAQEAQISVSEMQSAVGIYPAALGARSNETSGRAIMARQRESDVGSYVYFDNFEHAMRRTGEILVDIIPHFYDAERRIRIFGADDAEKFVDINRTVRLPDGSMAVMNDIAAGKYDIRIKTGPSYTSAREQAKEGLGQLIQARPDLLNIFGDLYFETLEFAGADKIAERMKRVIPPQISGEQQQPDPAAEQKMQEAATLARLQIADAEAKVTKAEAEAEGAKIDTLRKAHDFGQQVGGAGAGKPEAVSGLAAV